MTAKQPSTKAAMISSDRCTSAPHAARSMPVRTFFTASRAPAAPAGPGSPPRRAQARRHPRAGSAQQPTTPGWGGEAPRRGRGGSVAASFGRWPCGRGGCPAPLAADPPWRAARRLAGWHACRRNRPPPRARHPFAAQRSQARALPPVASHAMTLRVTLASDLPRRNPVAPIEGTGSNRSCSFRCCQTKMRQSVDN